MPRDTTFDTHDASDLEGRVLAGRYHVGRMIGKGSMGYVFEGERIEDSLPIAIKLPRPLAWAGRSVRQCFADQAKACAALTHPNIVRVLDFHVSLDEEFLNYIVMERLEGKSIDQFLIETQGRLPVSRFLDLLRQFAAALDTAHQARILHLDIKPANLLVASPMETGKVLDFGLMRIPDPHSKMDESGPVTFGTPAFFAPEQIIGSYTGPPADIYSFAMTIYALMARALAFDAEKKKELIYAHIAKEPLPLFKRNRRWPPGISKILRRSLAKEPHLRHRTAGELVEELAGALEPLSVLHFGSFFDATLDPLPQSQDMIRKMLTEE